MAALCLKKKKFFPGSLSRAMVAQLERSKAVGSRGCTVTTAVQMGPSSRLRSSVWGGGEGSGRGPAAFAMELVCSPKTWY